ncbi:hypothetical protein CL619_04335 [archaeon]|nr:hypothetical protein [archaeon]|tara:strand:- start:1181 stop:1720 length:540 start_codon:yes stop_codon:yes gene_type:complete
MANRRGQTEMIGLVVIVIMLTLGMLFLAKFALQEEPAKKIFTRKGLAYSTMSAVMKTELECYDSATSNDPDELKVQADLLEDCADVVRFNTAGDISCYGYDSSCDLLEEEISILLNATLGEWHKEYLFSAEVLVGTEPLTVLEIDSGGCATSTERDSSGLFPIYVTNVGLIESVLYICE